MVDIVERVDLSGVRCYWLPRQGPTVACLMFRVGRIDETLPTSGWTHLVEHLALRRAGATGSCNGRVELLRTVFSAVGSSDVVEHALRSVCEDLRDLPAGVEHLQRESRVLRREAGYQDPDPLSALLQMRFGARGPGLVGFDELGLARPSPEALIRWRDHHFTRNNATVWVAGPSPLNTALELPDGDPVAVPALPEPVREVPSWIAHDGSGGMAMSFVLQRSTAAATGSRLLQRRLFERLRVDQSLSYSIDVSYLPIAADLAHVMVWADLVDGVDPQRGVDTLVEVVDELQRSVPAGLLVEDREAVFSRMELEAAQLGQLDHRAFEGLLQRDDRDDHARELRQLEPEEISSALGSLVRRSIWVLPTGAVLPDHLEVREHVERAVPPVDGREYPARLHRTGEALRMVASSRGVTAEFDPVETGGARWHTVLFDRCAAVLAWDDGSRGLVSEDGAFLFVARNVWRDADGLIQIIDANAPRPFVPLGERELPRVRLRDRRLNLSRRAVLIAALAAAVILSGATILVAIGVDVPVNAATVTAGLLCWALVLYGLPLAAISKARESYRKQRRRRAAQLPPTKLSKRLVGTAAHGRATRAAGWAVTWIARVGMLVVFMFLIALATQLVVDAVRGEGTYETSNGGWGGIALIAVGASVLIYGRLFRREPPQPSNDEHQRPRLELFGWHPKSWGLIMATAGAIALVTSAN